MKKALLAVAALAVSITAQAFTPPKTVQTLIGWPPGAGNEITFRGVAATVEKQTGTNFIVINRPGADELIATNQVNKMPKDGSQIFIPSINMQLGVNYWHKDKLEHKVEDIIIVMTLAKSPSAIIAPTNSPINTPADMVKLIRETKKPVTFGLGAGAHDLIFEYIMDKTNGNRDQVKSVLYKGPMAAAIDVGGSQIDFAIVPTPVAYQLYKTGKVKYIGLAGDRTMKQLPGVPLMKDTIPGLSLSGHWMLALPAGTDKEIVDYYNQAFKTALQSPDTQRYFDENLLQAIPEEQTPEGVRAGLNNIIKTWGPYSQRLAPKYSFK